MNQKFPVTDIGYYKENSWSYALVSTRDGSLYMIHINWEEMQIHETVWKIYGEYISSILLIKDSILLGGTNSGWIVLWDVKIIDDVEELSFMN